MPYNYYWSADGGAPAYTSPELSIEYKDFQIVKAEEHSIYSIVPPLGKILHRSLEGGFTQIELAKRHIDEFLKTHQLNDAYSDKEVVAKVGRPTKDEAKERRKIELEKKLALLLEEFD